MTQCDALRRLTAVTDALGGQTACEYDSQGSVTKFTDANSNAARYTYDPADNMTYLPDETWPVRRMDEGE